MIRAISLLVILLLCNGMTSCGNSSKNTATILALTSSDRCVSDSLNSYEVFVPERKETDQSLPLLVILDPHGSGKSALQKFLLAAERYSAVLVASNLVKNNLPDYDAVIQKLIEDVRVKYPVGKVVFISGFSGGARMAIGYAMNHSVNGLLLCGALASPADLQKVGAPVYSISGTDDFNFMETAQYLFQEASIPANLKIELTSSSHNWPDSLTLADAFGYIRLACSDVEKISDTSLSDYVKQVNSKMDSLKNKGEWLKTMLVARNMSTTPPFNTDKTFLDLYLSLKAAPEYNAQIALLMENLQLEMQVLQPYLEALQTKNIDWWKNERNKIENQIQSAPNAFVGDANRRIKAFWGIACYSFCRQASQEHNAAVLNQILPIYRLLEPENPDMFYFSAFIPYWQGDQTSSILLLNKALQKGYTDRVQLQKDFPNLKFSQLHT